MCGGGGEGKCERGSCSFQLTSTGLRTALDLRKHSRKDSFVQFQLLLLRGKVQVSPLSASMLIIMS